MHYCPSALQTILASFRPGFTGPGFRHFQTLLVAWIVVRGRHTISSMIRVMRQKEDRRHPASIYRFLTLGRWSIDSVGWTLFRLFRGWLSDEIHAIVDDTLCAKSGRQIFGTGVHHDGARSSYRGGRRLDVLTFGHSWVVLAIVVRCPWNEAKTWAIPILFRLYRAKRTCPDSRYKKRSELALSLIRRLASWLGPEESLRVTGDGAYCCKTVLQGLPARTHFVGPLPLKAALYDLSKRPAHRGRPRKKGYRIANPKTRLAQRGGTWKEAHVLLYGRSVRVTFSSLVCIWYPSAGTHPVCVVMTRDPRKKSSGRAYVCTDPSLSPEEILAAYAERWQLEVTFRDLKQELGFEDPQNGWWRRRAGKRDDPCRKAVQRPRGKKAVERTAPLAGIVYGLTLLWYFSHGRRRADLARARRAAPWYRHKTDVSYADMLSALRRRIWMAAFRRTRLSGRLRRISQELWLLAGNAA